MSLQPRIKLLQEAVTIEKERGVLQGKLDQLEARFSRIKEALFSTDGTAAPVVEKAAPAVKKRKSAVKKAPAAKQAHTARGELKQRILDALAAAGKEGIRVRDLAAKIGVKQEALHSWFQFAKKRISAIRKAGKGRYRLAEPVAETTATASKLAKSTAAPVGSHSSGKQRGELSSAVNAALKTAGKDGVRVGDLAKKIGISPRNLFVWFATTAKKFPVIKKAGPGHYFIEDSYNQSQGDTQT